MSIPFRLPCGGDKNYRGTCFNHSPSPVLRDKYTNSTTVPNPAGGDPIPPYERWTPDMSGGDSCEVHHCVTDPGAAPCSQWLLPYTANTFSHAPDDTVDFAVCHKRGFKNVQARRFWSGRFGYLHKETNNGPDTTQFCASTTAIKAWRGYTPTVSNTKYLTLSVTAESQEQQYIPSSMVNWDDTASYTQVIDPLSGVLSHSSLSVSPNRSDNRALSEIFRGQWFFADIVSDMVRNLRSPISPSGHIDWTDNSITVWDDVLLTGTPVQIEAVTWDLAGGAFERYLYSYDGTGTQHVDDHYVVTVTDSSLSYRHDFYTYSGSDMATSGFITVSATLEGSNTSAGIYADVKNNLLWLWPLNDDALYPWRTDSKVSVAPMVSRDEILTTNFNVSSWVKDFGSPITDAGGATIGDPTWSRTCALVISQDVNTGTQVVAIPIDVNSGDTVDMYVSGFSFTEVTGYSMSGTLPPGVSFDSSTGHISGTATATGRYGVTVTVSGAAPAATGNILGAPKPSGYQNYFDFGYRDWAGCCFRPPDNPGFQTWSWYQVGWGGTVGAFNIAASCSLPLNATQWTNFFQSVNKPQGAFLFYNDPCTAYYPGDCVSSDAISGVLDGNALWAGKYAECLEQWPSENFALPAGEMKFWFDETLVFCAVNASGSGEGSTWTLTDPNTGIAPPDSTSFIGLWGGPVVGGFYEVTGYSGGTLTLGTLIYTVPNGWASKSNGDSALCFGKLRFPNYPSMLGRIAITPDTAGTTFTFATPQPNFGMHFPDQTEKVDLWDAAMVPVAGNVTATRVDDSNFTTVAAYPNARYVTITGAAKWYMNDTGPKGDYAMLEWLADLRSIGEYGRLSTITDCSGTQVPQPTTNVGGGDISIVFPQPAGCNIAFASFSQTAGCLPFIPCSPKVVCISPNAETWPNGTTYPFPPNFACDEQYGSKWWGFVQSNMTDLFWQKPHRPCNIESCALWKQDDLTCHDDNPLDCPLFCCPGDDGYLPSGSDTPSQPPVYYYAFPPQVEARLTVPCNYGNSQDECAHNIPGFIQIGWLSPVLFTVGDVALPPTAPGAVSDHGEPAGANTAWNVHDSFCAHSTGCRFNYSLPNC